MTSDLEKPAVAAGPAQLVAALRGSHERLRGLVTVLTAEQLSGRSYDSEWSIAQVLSHLGSGAEIFGLFLRAARDGGEQPGREVFGPIWDRWNAKTPQDMAADSLASNETFVAELEALDADELTGLRLALLGAERDISEVARMRLSEHAIHTWDVEVALDPAATIAQVPVDLLIDSVGQTAGYAAKPSGLQATVRVRTSQPARDLALVVGDAVTLQPWADGEAAAEGVAELTLPAEALIRLVAGRLDAEHTPAYESTGVDLADLRPTFPGY